MGCEEVDLNGQLVVPPYVDPHLHLDYVFTASLGEENGSRTLLKESSVGVNQKEI